MTKLQMSLMRDDDIQRIVGDMALELSEFSFQRIVVPMITFDLSDQDRVSRIIARSRIERQKLR